MNRNLLSLAVATALAATAGSAFALTPSVTSGIAAANQVRLSGATAQDPGIVAYFRLACNAGTLDSFTKGTTVAFSCTHSTLGNIVAQKESASGSNNGNGPVRDGTPLTFIDVTTISTANCVSTGTGFGVQAAVGTLGTYTKWNCAGSTSGPVAPQIGFSDVDPSIFGESTAGLDIKSPNQIMFGVPVTLNLRNALQTAQGLVSGSELSANVPSLSQSQVAGVFTGNLLTAADIGVSGDTGALQVVRRADTSGSQKAAELNILNQNVNPGNNPIAFPVSTTPGVTSTGGEAFAAGKCTVAGGLADNGVFAGNGSGDVRNCLSELQTNSRYGVGVLSMESNQSGANWRWVKLDGVMPTVANAIRGKYKYWVEQVMNKKTTLSGVPLSLYTHINANIGNSAIIPVLNSTFTVFTDEPAGQQATGIMAPALVDGVLNCPAVFSGTTVTPDNSPINISSKSVSGTADNRLMPAIAICAPRF